MIHQVYAIRDLKAEAYLQPFFSSNDSTALRSFAEACNKSDTPFSKHPADFAIFHVGYFNDENGEMGMAKLRNMGLASDFLESK